MEKKMKKECERLGYQDNRYVEDPFSHRGGVYF